jgi:aryl-alcohol dehydrogenase-like predicted oxidoreductase
MEYRNLGRTGVQASALCLGGMLFGEPTDEAEALKIIDRALDVGLNFLDTANIYNRGRSEEIVGRALRRDGRRARVVLATKVHGAMDDHDPNAWGNSRRHILEQCEASLRRLQTDFIDLYQLHRPLSTIPIDETLRAMDDLVHSGKVRYLGTSTFAAWQQGATPSQVALAWVAQQPGVTSPIIGPRTLAQLEDCLGAVHVRLTAEDRARLDAVAAPGRAIVPYCEADFGPHRFRW